MGDDAPGSRSPQPPVPGGQDLAGVTLVEPAPRYLKLVAWIWIVITLLHLAIVTVYLFLLVFSGDEDVEHRMLPESPKNLIWIVLLLSLVVLVARVAALAAVLRRDRAQLSVKVAWVILVLSMLGHIADALRLEPRLTNVGDLSMSPVPIVFLASVTLVLLFIPPVLKWFWIPGPEVVPFQTYYTEIALEDEIRQLESGEAEIRLPSVEVDESEVTDIDDR